MPVRSDQDVVRFQVSVNVLHLMHRVHSSDYLSDIELALPLRENIFSYQLRHEITSLQKLHNQIKVLLIPESCFQLSDPRVLSDREDFFFSLNVGNLIFLDHILLQKLLYSDHFAVSSVPTDPDFSESAPSNNGQGLEIFSCQLSTPG